MQANFHLHRPTLPASEPATLDVLVSFNAGTPQNASRRPLNLSLVLDRSGSMAGKPLQQAIAAARTLVDRLQPEDQLSIVTYDDHVSTILPPQPLKDKAAIRSLLSHVKAGGCTNLSGGWLEGCRHVAQGRSAELVNRVLLLTDGQANAGITDPNVLTQTAREKAGQGVLTTTLGFGASFNEDLLIAMATAGEGHFYFIQSPEDAAGVFGIELDSLASVAAQNLSATLKLAPGVRLKAVLNRYPVATAGEEISVTLGDVYGVEDKQLVLSLELDPAAAGDRPLGVVTYRYDQVVDGAIQQHTGEVPLTVRVAAPGEPAAAVNAEVAARANQLRFAQAKEEAIALADQRQFDSAAAKLRQVVAAVSLGPAEQSFDMLEELEALEYYASQLASKAYDANLRKELRDQSYQGRTRSRGDLALRGTSGGSADGLPQVTDAGQAIVLKCVRAGGKLHVYPDTDAFDRTKRVQFPRALREEGVSYLVDELLPSADGTFYRANGAIRRLLRPGEVVASRHATRRSAGGKASTAAGTAADLPTTTDVGNGVLVQCVKEGSKLRARVVSDGFDPNWNMRFPRSIREENTLYVVDEVIDGPGGGSYIACGKIHRLVQ